MNGSEQILSDAAIACPDWQSFYYGGMLMGTLMMLIVCAVIGIGMAHERG